LFADEQAKAVDPELWPALAAGASTQIEPATAASVPELFKRHAPFYSTVARAEHALFPDVSEFADSNATLWTISHLLRELANPLQLESQLPLDLLARHAATRAGVATSAALRVAVLKDYLQALTEQMTKALAGGQPPSLGRRVRTRLDLALALGAQRATDPLKYLTTHTPSGRWRSLWVAWRAARTTVRGAK
jgi:hypothetical protein